MPLPIPFIDDCDNLRPDMRASRTRPAPLVNAANAAEAAKFLASTSLTAPSTPALAPSAAKANHTELSSLRPSLLQDLRRFDSGPPQHELLEVLAAALRHAQALAIDLAWGGSALTLTVFPQRRRLHCPLPLADWACHDLGALRVRRVRPALLHPAAAAAAPSAPDDLDSLESPYAPGAPDTSNLDPANAIPNRVDPGALAPLLWLVALQGSRAALLPELNGPAAYRVAPGLSLAGLAVPGAMATCIARLRRQTCNLAEIAGWTGVGKERAMRLLNALYLQAGLIVSRSHPAATAEDWRGYRD